MFDAGQEGGHEVGLLLNRRLVRCVMRYLVRWRGHFGGRRVAAGGGAGALPGEGGGV